MRTITKLRRSTRGLSPIFATLILIAIAVIAGIIVYMFTSGTLAAMLGGGTTGQEKVAIQAVAGNSSNSIVTIYAQSTGGGPVALDAVILKDSMGTVRGTVASTSIVNATLAPFDATFTGLMTSGNTYTVTLVSKAGGSFVSPSFKAVT